MGIAPMPRAKPYAIRFDDEEKAMIDRLTAHFAAKYPSFPITLSRTIKLALEIAERVELGEAPPAPPSSRPRPRKTVTRPRSR